MKLVAILLALLGVAFLVCAYIYWVTPASMLPHFFPGYTMALTKIHKTHALASAGVGVGAFILAWFLSGSKSTKK